MSPPTSSTASAISDAVQVGVPLKSRCSRKWEAPARSSSSSREPVPTHTPTAAERTSGMRSVTSRAPQPRTSAWITGAGTGPGRAGWPSPAPRTAVAPVAPGGALAAVRGAPGTGTEVAELARELGLEGGLEGGDWRRGAALVPGPGAPGLSTPLAGAVAAGRRRGGAGERQRDLALRIDVVDLHLELLAQGDDVLDPLHTLARSHPRDVQQPVAAREDVHEGPELRDVHHLARVGGADLCLGRLDD